MITDSYKRFLQVLFLAALQVLVFSHIHLWGYATPLVFVSLLIYVPSSSPRIPTLIWSFLLGLFVDIINTTPGVACGSMTLAAMCQRPLLGIMAPRDSGEDITPSYSSMGTTNHVRYVALLIGIHQIAYFILDIFSFHHIGEFFLYALSSYVLTLLIVLAMERLRDKMLR